MNYKNENTPMDAFEAGLKFSEDVAELLMGLILLLQLIFAEADSRKIEDKKAEIYRQFEKMQMAQQAGIAPEKIIQMLILNTYGVADILKMRRAEQHKPEVSFKEKLSAYRRMKI